jgi:hypothetical protein
MHLLVLELAALLEDLVQVPGDRLALAIRVGRQIQRAGFLQRLGDRLDVPLVALDQLVLHREAVVRIDRAFLGHQIAHVAIGGQHLEILAQVFLDRARLGGRFDDDQILSHAKLRTEPETKNRGRAAGALRATCAGASQCGTVSGQVINQIFHPRTGCFLARLAREHHQHDPLDLLQIQLLGVERQQPLDDDLALARREDAARSSDSSRPRQAVQARAVPAASRCERPPLPVSAGRSRCFGQIRQPVERPLDVGAAKAGAFQIARERLALSAAGSSSSM